MNHPVKINLRHVLQILFLLFVSSSLTVAAETVCRFGEMVRSVDVVYSDPGQAVPCEVLYNKQSEGSQSVLWRADNEAGYCEEKARGFVEKLEGMGWQCASDGNAAPVPEAPDSVSPPTPPADLSTVDDG